MKLHKTDEAIIKTIKKVERFYDNHSVMVFLVLSVIYFWGAMYRVAIGAGCSTDKGPYFYRYIIVMLIPFFMVQLPMAYEKVRNRREGKESSAGLVHSLDSFVMTILFVGMIIIDFSSFFSNPECEKFGDEYSNGALVVGFYSFICYAVYLVLLVLIAIYRKIRSHYF